MSEIKKRRCGSRTFVELASPSPLADYLLKSDKPVAVTRHGETIGYFIPARAGRAELDRAALKKAASNRRAREVSPEGRPSVTGMVTGIVYPC